ncbi:hypothetical protein L1887_25360 [Cichorium endivia]|nr:hypothetical protein L1887_25360 [Cichorium endivia]
MSLMEVIKFIIVFFSCYVSLKGFSCCYVLPFLPFYNVDDVNRPYFIFFPIIASKPGVHHLLPKLLRGRLLIGQFYTVWMMENKEKKTKKKIPTELFLKALLRVKTSLKRISLHGKDLSGAEMMGVSLAMKEIAGLDAKDIDFSTEELSD